MRFRLKIVERMAVGFGLMLLILAVFAWVMDRQTRKIEEARRELTTQISPLIDAADSVAIRVLNAGIGVRAWALDPTAEALLRHHQQVVEARASLLALELMPREPDAEAAFQQARPLLEDYLAECQRFVERGKENANEASEQRLSARREKALTALNAFTKLQRGKMNRALLSIQGASNHAESGTALVVLVALLLFLLLAVFTVRSVREPTQHLVDVARRMEGGDWSAALELARVSVDRHARDELGILRHAFGAAATALEGREQRLKSLVSELRGKNDQIQAQNEELQVQNEELQVQGEEIHTQNEELQAQSEEIRAQNEELARASARLRGQAEVLAEEDERKTEFLGVLAHELRNPLAAISNSLFAMKRGVGNLELRERAEQVIERQTRLLSRLIEDLLDVTRINSGKIRIDREPVDLATVLRSAVEDCKIAAERAGTRVELQLPTQPALVEGDPMRLQQVMGNLIDNAIKFGGDKKPIKVLLEVKDDRSTEVRVTDDGVGIDAELLRRLFVPFSQADTSVKRHRTGLGLGLALVKALVELHGGKVTAFSEGLGRGAEFCVRFPAPK